MGKMAQELVPLGFQPGKAFAQPDNAFTDGAQLARTGKQRGVVQRLPLPQSIDHSLNALHRADNHAGEQQHQRQAEQEQHQRLPAEELPALGDFLLQLLPARIDHRSGCLHHVAIGRGKRFQAGG